VNILPPPATISPSVFKASVPSPHTVKGSPSRSSGLINTNTPTSLESTVKRGRGRPPKNPLQRSAPSVTVSPPTAPIIDHTFRTRISGSLVDALGKPFEGKCCLLYLVHLLTFLQSPFLPSSHSFLLLTLNRRTSDHRRD
jgi:hypothetical protein